jgi:outer membrane protein TolC
MQAMEDYWNWVKAYQTYIVVSNIVEINNTRLDFVRKSFNNGERAATDTTEAFAQLQSFQILKNEKWLDFLNAGLELSIYLWTNKNQSYLLPQNIIPQTNWQTELKEDKYNLILADLLENASSNHPQLNMYRAKLNGLEIDRKLKMQELLPTLDVKYNQLSKTYNPFYNGNVSPLLENNFQYGLKIEMPLRISAGRGEYRKSLLKLEETKLAFAQKDVALEIKISKYFNQYLNLKNQIDLQKNNLLNYKQLVKAEETRLINGESNLFLINTRENKMLEAQEKLIELQTKYFKSIYALQWSAGLLQ